MTAHGQIAVKLGRLRIAFDGVNKISQPVIDELAAPLPATHETPHLIFRFVSNIANETKAVPINVLRGVIADFTATGDQSTLQVAARPLAPDWVIGSDLAIKALEMNFLTLDELRAKNFVYKLFNWTVQIRQLELGQSFIHASALTKNKRTIAVLGKGGVGKTSAMLKLCSENDWRYLSDDLAVIDDDGVAYRSPARLQVYAYNTQGYPQLEQRLLHGRTLFDRLQWSLRRQLLGVNKVRRRVSAEFLFGKDGVVKAAPLTDLFFLERGTAPGVALSDLSAEDAAARMAPIVMDEIKPYAEIYRETEAIAPGALPSPEDVEEKTRDILQRAFSRATAKLLRAGPEVGPDELAQTLSEIADAPN